MTRRHLIALPFAAAALANRWEEPQFPHWSEKFIDQILTDSPWARPWKGTAVQPVGDQRILSNWFQIGGIGLPPLPGTGWPRIPQTRRQDTQPAVLRIAVDLTIRWASALPVRRALALQEFGPEGLSDPRAVELLSTEPRDIVVELAGIPHTLTGDSLWRELRETVLTLPGRRPLKPLSVDLPPMGVTVNAKLRFARADASMDGNADLFVPAGALRMQEHFKLRSMTYEGRLEL